MATLALSVNPDLRWQEVRDILRRACDRIDPQGGAYDANGRSPFYGYGRLNAETAVKLARPTPRNSVVINRNFNLPLPDLQSVSAAFEVGETNAVESFTVHVEILHTYIGDLVVTLVPPTGLNVRQVVLHNRSGGATRNLKRTYDAMNTPSLSTFRGMSLKGT
ncbi:MAG: proprotein convertase P-domain-containing protein [Candidatus Entotheonellia bacterium]